MKRSSTIFLQIILILLGLVVLAGLLIEPTREGANIGKTLSQIYFADPFLAYVYLGSIPFFVALYHAFKILGHARRNNVFSPAVVHGLHMIKYCAFVTAGAIIGAGVIIKISSQASNDDPAGALMLSMISILASIVIGTSAAMFERIVQNAVDMKSENDLTV